MTADTTAAPARPAAGGWGIGPIFHALDVYWPAEPSEERIQREMNRLTHR